MAPSLCASVVYPFDQVQHSGAPARPEAGGLRRFVPKRSPFLSPEWPPASVPLWLISPASPIHVSRSGSDFASTSLFLSVSICVHPWLIPLVAASPRCASVPLWFILLIKFNIPVLRQGLKRVACGDLFQEEAPFCPLNGPQSLCLGASVVHPSRKGPPASRQIDTKIFQGVC
jgi:hypothetical protein